MTGFSRLSRPTLVLLAATAAFVLFFGATNWYRQVNLLTAQFDMGNMDQVLWHSLHGHWFQMTSPVLAELQSRTAIHADFLLLGYLPFYALWPDPRVPLVLQVLAVASGVIPLFWLARQRLGERLGALIGVLYLLYPTLQWGMTFDVHAVILATPLFLWAWWAATERRWRLYGVAAGLALLAKEEAGLVVAAMGLYWVWRRGYRRMGLLSLLIGLAWSMLMVGWAIPAARQAPGHFALGYYTDFGGTYTDILRNVISHPLKTLSRMFDWPGIAMLRALLLPVGFLALLGLPVLLVALPELAINLLSNNPNQKTIFFQYLAVITPFVFLALVDGWERGRRWLRRPPTGWLARHGERWVVGGVGAAALVSVWLWAPLPGSRFTEDALRAFRPSPYRQDVAFIGQSLQPSDRVAATNNLAPQFSRRDRIWGFPKDLDHADAIVVLQGGDHELLPKEEIDAAVQALAINPAFTLVYRRDRFWYFRKR